MKRFQDLKVKNKLTILFSVIMVLVLVFGYMCITSITTTTERHEAVYDEYAAGASYLGEITYNFELMSIKAEFIMLTQNEQARENAIGIYKNAKTQMQAHMEEFRDTMKDEDVRSHTTVISPMITSYVGVLDSMIQQVRNGNVASVMESLEYLSLHEQLDKINTELETLFDLVYQQGRLEDEALAVRSTKTTTICTVLGLFVLLFSVCICVYLIRMINAPLGKLKAAADKLALGDVEVDIKRESGDEFGDLSESFAKMAENLQGQAVIAKQLATGDRTMNVVPRSEKDVVGNALQYMMVEENHVLSSIKEASYQVTTGSEQVASASQSLAQGSTEQASAIQQITASIDEITQRTKINANDANETNKLVIEAREHAELGNTRMEQMRGAMAEINDSSENISRIIKVIDDIAFQTNILALNAAVEAARAGQHGRGFAVVADEVRTLAGKSAQAASETAELIEDSIRKVAHGSALAEETAEALEKIVASIERVVDLVNSIAIASNDQATAITQIDQAILQVSQVVQTNSATSEQCAAASEELSAQAARLRDMITRYQLKPVEYSAVAQPMDNIQIPYLTASAQNVISLGEGFGKY